MKTTGLSVSARILLLSSAFWIVACRDSPRQKDSVDSEAKTSAARQEASTAEEQDGEPGKLGSTEDAPATDEQITELRREIESGRQNIEDLEAFAQMERTKLENDPDYDPSFLQEALQEQEHLRETIESGESRLQELTRPNE